jgi:hypothetical protein
LTAIKLIGGMEKMSMEVTAIVIICEECGFINEMKKDESFNIDNNFQCLCCGLDQVDIA